MRFPGETFESEKNEIESLVAMRLPRTYGLVRSTIMINRFVVLFLFFTGSLFSEEIRKLPNDIRWVDTLWNMKIFVDRFTNRHGKRSKNSLAKLRESWRLWLIWMRRF